MTTPSTASTPWHAAWKYSWHHRSAWFSAAVLTPVFVASYAASFWLRFEPEGLGALTRHAEFGQTVAWVVLIKLAAFSLCGVYQSLNRYLTFHDLLILGRAVALSAAALVLCDYFFYSAGAIPRSVLLADSAFTLVAVGGVRAAIRFLQERDPASLWPGSQTPVLIVGANDSGEMLLRAIRRRQTIPYRVGGFIAEDPQQARGRIGGVPVLGALAQTCELAARYGVQEVLLTAGELSGKQMRALIESGREVGVTVKVLPSYEQLLSGSVDLRPRTVSIEDLLRREPVRLHLAELRRWLNDRVILVTGSAGSIGSEICRQLLPFAPRRLILVDRSENGQFHLERELRARFPHAELEVCVADAGDALRMQSIFKVFRPEVVFHAAAYKHVPLMEFNSGEGVKNIVLATKCVADLAEEFGVGSFVMISTDKAVKPTSVMGACKRVAELYVQSLAAESACRFVTVRFGNVLDSAGSVVPIFREQIADGGPVTVTHPDMVRYFMTIPEASQLVIQAGAMGQGGEIFVLNMGEPVKIVDLAADMIRLSGLRVGDDIEIEFTGLRPGEKMFEELYFESERHVATEHPKILVAACDRRPRHEIAAAVERLRDVADGSSERVRSALQHIVPEYRPTTQEARARRSAA